MNILFKNKLNASVISLSVFTMGFSAQAMQRPPIDDQKAGGEKQTYPCIHEEKAGLEDEQKAGVNVGKRPNPKENNVFYIEGIANNIAQYMDGPSLSHFTRTNDEEMVQMAVNHCIELYTTAIVKGSPVPAEAKDALSHVTNSEHREKITETIALKIVEKSKLKDSKIAEKIHGSRWIIHVPRELPPFLQPYFEGITGPSQRMNTYMQQQNPKRKPLPPVLLEAVLHMEACGYYYLPKWKGDPKIYNVFHHDPFESADDSEMQKRNRLAGEQLYNQFYQRAQGYIYLEDAHATYERERALAATKKREMLTIPYTHVTVPADALMNVESRGRIRGRLHDLCTQKADLTLVIDFVDETHTPDEYGVRRNLPGTRLPENQQRLPNTVRHVAVIGRNLHTIGEGFLSFCTNLASVTLPNSVTHIGIFFLNNCTNVTSVNIQNSITHIGDHFLSRCTKLTSIIIPNSVTHIGNYFLHSCSNLSSVILPNSVTHIGDTFLSGCNNLSSIILPNSVTHIGDFFLNNCTKLTSVILPNSVTQIGRFFLYGCTNVTSVVLPNSVTHIGDHFFVNCTKIRNRSVKVNRDVSEFLELLRENNPELARDVSLWPSTYFTLSRAASAM